MSLPGLRPSPGSCAFPIQYGSYGRSHLISSPASGVSLWVLCPFMLISFLLLVSWGLCTCWALCLDPSRALLFTSLAPSRPLGYALGTPPRGCLPCFLCPRRPSTHSSRSVSFSHWALWTSRISSSQSATIVFVGGFSLPVALTPERKGSLLSTVFSLQHPAPCSPQSR